MDNVIIKLIARKYNCNFTDMLSYYQNTAILIIWCIGFGNLRSSYAGYPLLRQPCYCITSNFKVYASYIVLNSGSISYVVCPMLKHCFLDFLYNFSRVVPLWPSILFTFFSRFCRINVSFRSRKRKNRYIFMTMERWEVSGRNRINFV